jgi:hypothetical protein
MYPIITFVRILTSDYMHPIGHPRHDSNYKFMKINFIHSTKHFYAASEPKKTFVHILTSDFMHPNGHHETWFKFMNFKKFQKYIQNGSWNVHKNIRSSMVKTIFESDALLRNYRKKTKENYMRCISLCARQPCQLVSGAVWWNTQLGESFFMRRRIEFNSSND